jgi:hypothetical protein
MGKTDKILWEDAILRAIEDCGGVATLKELYQLVPKIRGISSSLDVNHVIRAYLRRMTRISGKLKKVGLGIYALPDAKLERNLYEDIQKGKTKEEIFKDISDDELHSYVEGMLIELGNIYGYLTYTANPSSLFNGKPLREIVTLKRIPEFTSHTLLSIAKTIDVIWFGKRATVAMPKHTFDVEITTDFSKALHRAYQLRDFKTTFYVVGPKNRQDQFQRRLTTDPYHEISDRVFFRSVDDIFSLYEAAIKHFELMDKIIIET